MKLLPTPQKKSRKKLVTWETSKRKCKSGGRASKAKGRTAVVKVRELLLKEFNHLGPDDVLVKATSQGGCDLHLSPLAQMCFPFAIEVKNVEKFNLWAALAQAKNNAVPGDTPIVFFKRSHTPLFVALDAEEFVKLISRGE